MSAQSFVVHVSGNPHVPSIRLVNVRSGPGTAVGNTVLFQINVGQRDLRVLDVKPDVQNTMLNNKVYQWLQVALADGRSGWVRDDLVEIQGDGRRFGYPLLTSAQYAFNVLRQAVVAPVGVVTPPPAPVTPPPVAAPKPSVPAPVPVPLTPVPPTPPAVMPTNTELTGIVIGRDGLNLRVQPVSGTVLARLPFLGRVKIVGAQPQAGTAYIWAKVETPQGNGWVRSDFLSITGDGTALGLCKGDEYAPPVSKYWWVRGHNDDQKPTFNSSEPPHLGWDIGIDMGEPVMAGPSGGTVMQVLKCRHCTFERPSVLDNNLQLNTPSVFSDPDWGFGYGNAIVVRYLFQQLPASAKERLSALNLQGGHLYVMYAHLRTIDVMPNQLLSPQARIGSAGNTGNSQAPHLHLELRASLSPNETSWSMLRARTFDPDLVFRR